MAAKKASLTFEDYLRGIQGLRQDDKMKNGCLLILKDLTLSLLGDEPLTVILFGSRAREEHHPFSDVDIGLIPHGEFEEGKISLLREQVEDLNIPYKVEIVNLSEVSEEFKKEAVKSIIVWKD